MATSMEGDSEVHFKEKREGKGVKTETAVDDATLQFEFRASTPAASPSGGGAEHRGGDGEEPRRIELKKFSLRPEKYDGKVDFEGWVNQFEEYATLGQWTEEEKSSLLFLDRGSPYVLRRVAGTRENGIRDQSGGPQASVWTRNGHQHRSAGVGRTEERKESVRQGTS